MNTKVRSYLIELARSKVNQTVTYQKLCNDCGLKLDMKNNPYDRIIIGNILDEISTYEHKQGRPLLSSLVIRLSDGEEGEGFFKMAEKLGFGKVKTLKENMFEYIQITESIKFWKTDSNYLNYK